jgi:hypothetical protein
MADGKYRPQNKNLRLFNEIPVEEARAIQSAGGKACAEARKKRQAMSDLLLLYSGLPIKDARVRNRLKRLGVPDEELTQKFQIADALVKMAQTGNTQAIALYLDSIGELSKGAAEDKENNLFQMIEQSSSQEVDIDDIPEIRETPESDVDMVEPPESEEL